MRLNALSLGPVVASLLLLGCPSDPESNTGNGGDGPGGEGSGASAGMGGANGGAGGVAAGGAGGEAGGGGGGGAPLTGTHSVVGVGTWGLRAIAGEDDAWNVCGNPSTGNDHSPDLLRSVGYGNGLFVAVGGDANSMVMRSFDGVHWEEDLHPVTGCDAESYPQSCQNWMGGVAYGNGVWIAGGGNGALMRSSDDGLSWVGLHPADRPNAVRSVAYGGGTFVAGTDGDQVSVSTDDGDTWIHHSVSAHASQVSFGGGTIIVKGRSYNGSGFDYGCSVSTDGAATWNTCDPQILATDGAVWDGTQFVSGDDDTYLTSPDGVTWTSHPTTNFPSQFLFVGERWIGLRGGRAFTSTNLTDWQETAQDIPGFRGWAAGVVLDANLPVTNVDACEDNR